MPYRDVIPAIADLGRAHPDRAVVLAAAQSQIETGKVKLIAITSRERTSIAPDAPTVAEAGFPALTLDGLIGLYGPRGMPLDRRETIAAAFREIAAAEPLIAQRLAATGQVVKIIAPEEFAARIKEQRDQLAAIAKTLGLEGGAVMLRLCGRLGALPPPLWGRVGRGVHTVQLFPYDPHPCPLPTRGRGTLRHEFAQHLHPFADRFGKARLWR